MPKNRSNKEKQAHHVIHNKGKIPEETIDCCENIRGEIIQTIICKIHSIPSGSCKSFSYLIKDK